MNFFLILFWLLFWILFWIWFRILFFRLQFSKLSALQLFNYKSLKSSIKSARSFFSLVLQPIRLRGRMSPRAHGQPPIQLLKTKWPLRARRSIGTRWHIYARLLMFLIFVCRRPSWNLSLLSFGIELRTWHPVGSHLRLFGGVCFVQWLWNLSMKMSHLWWLLQTIIDNVNK